MEKQLNSFKPTNPLLKLAFLIVILSLSSCSSSPNLLTKFIKFLPDDISSFRTFFYALLILYVEILTTAIIISLILGRIGYPITLVIYFIMILVNKDYGFWMTTLLFIIGGIGMYIILIIFQKIRMEYLKDKYTEY